MDFFSILLIIAVASLAMATLMPRKTEWELLALLAGACSTLWALAHYQPDVTVGLPLALALILACFGLAYAGRLALSSDRRQISELLKDTAFMLAAAVLAGGGSTIFVLGTWPSATTLDRVVAVGLAVAVCGFAVYMMAEYLKKQRAVSSKVATQKDKFDRITFNLGEK